MSENPETPDSKSESARPAKPFEPTMEDRSFHEVLESQLGRVFLIANPESFEEGGLGPEIRPHWYRAKLLGMGKDYLIVMAEFHHGAGKKATKEPMRQYIPVSRIKRLSIMKSERLLHL